jgi:hypothetical protein
MTDYRQKMTSYFQPAFVCCVGVLLLSGTGMSMMIQGLGGYLKKETLPLARSFETMDEAALHPYRIVSKIDITDKDVLKSLGTRDYVQWILEDTLADPAERTQRFMLFLTYYPLPDRVPHVPEECYLGGGFQRLATDSLVWTPEQTDLTEAVTARYLVFGQGGSQVWHRGQQVPVVYLFKVNGQYASNRDEARIILNKNIFGKSSYFSKVELVFNQGTGPLSQEQTVTASQQALKVLLPVLERDHWPAWKGS